MDMVVAPVDKLEAALKALEDATHEFEQVYTKVTFDEDLSVDQALAFLIRLRDVIGRARFADDALVDACRDLPSKQIVIVPDLGTAEAKWGQDRKAWKHDALAGLVVEKMMAQFVDPETGTIDAPYSVLMKEILKYAHVDYWRTTALKELDITTDEFCEKSPGRFSVVTRPNSKPGF